MVKRLVLSLGLFASTAWAEGLVVTEDRPAGAKVTSEHVRAAKVPAALEKWVVTADSLHYVNKTVLRFPLRKGDLVLWTAFFPTGEHVEACTAALSQNK